MNERAAYLRTHQPQNSARPIRSGMHPMIFPLLSRPLVCRMHAACDYCTQSDVAAAYLRFNHDSSSSLTAASAFVWQWQCVRKLRAHRSVRVCARQGYKSLPIARVRVAFVCLLDDAPLAEAARNYSGRGVGGGGSISENPSAYKECEELFA